MVALLRVVPIWAWALAAALVWGAWQRHEARQQGALRAADAAAVAQQREAALAATIAESQRRTAAVEESAHVADLAASAARSDAARSAALARRLREQLAAGRAASAPAGEHPASAGAGQADRLADVLGQCVERYRAVAADADAAVVAGRACERAYDALTR